MAERGAAAGAVDRAAAGFFPEACGLARGFAGRAASRCGRLRPDGLVDFAMIDARAVFHQAQSTLRMASQPCVSASVINGE